jgi:hypothetical protein
VCTPKAPKVNPNSQTAKTPDPAIIRNPYLDNATEFAQARMGRSSLRIDPGSPKSARIPLPSSAQPATPTPPVFGSQDWFKGVMQGTDKNAKFSAVSMGALGLIGPNGLRR